MAVNIAEEESVYQGIVRIRDYIWRLKGCEAENAHRRGLLLTRKAVGLVKKSWFTGMMIACRRLVEKEREREREERETREREECKCK